MNQRIPQFLAYLIISTGASLAISLITASFLVAQTASLSIARAEVYLARSMIIIGDGDGGGVTSPLLTIARVGAGSSDTDAGHVIASSTAVLTRLQFIGDQGRDITVRKLQFGVSAADTNVISTGLADEVSTILLKECTTIACTTKNSVIGLPIASAGPAAGTVIAQDSNGFFTVPSGGSKFFAIEAILNPIAVGSNSLSDSGTRLFASLLLSNFEAIASDGTPVTKFATSTGGTGRGVTGLEKVVLRSEPLLSVARPPSILANGVTPVIDVTAGAKSGPIGLKAFGINIAATGATVITPTLSNVSVVDITGGGILNVTVGSVAGSAVLSGGNSDIYIVLANPEIVNPGAPKTYRVRVTAQNVSTTVGAARLVTRLDRNETKFVTSTRVNASTLLTANGSYGTSTKVWVWSDLSDNLAANELDTQWMNAAYVRPFSLDAVTITN